MTPCPERDCSCFAGAGISPWYSTSTYWSWDGWRIRTGVRDSSEWTAEGGCTECAMAILIVIIVRIISVCSEVAATHLLRADNQNTFGPTEGQNEQRRETNRRRQRQTIRYRGLVPTPPPPPDQYPPDGIPTPPEEHSQSANVDTRLPLSWGQGGPPPSSGCKKIPLPASGMLVPASGRPPPLVHHHPLWANCQSPPVNHELTSVGRPLPSILCTTEH